MPRLPADLHLQPVRAYFATQPTDMEIMTARSAAWPILVADDSLESVVGFEKVSEHMNQTQKQYSIVPQMARNSRGILTWSLGG